MVLGGVYACYTALSFGRWGNLARWTRLHYSIDLATGVAMVVGALVLFLASHGSFRAAAVLGGSAAGVLGLSLIAGALLGTIPCSGAS